MSQIRFNLGVPRGGSAARIAEDDAVPTRSIRPQAGSAARDAEERKRVEGVSGPRAFSIGLRAQGAAVPSSAVGTSATVDGTATNREAAVLQLGTVTVRRQSAVPVDSVFVHTGSSSVALPNAAPLSAKQADEASVPSMPPVTAVSRVKSLVQSLFSSGSSTGTL